MFESGSRYYNIETVTVTLHDGTVVAYKRRRFLPALEAMQVVGEVTVGDRDRLDLIAYRAFGNAEQFWHLCDSNSALNPSDNELPGTRLAIAILAGGA